MQCNVHENLPFKITDVLYQNEKVQQKRYNVLIQLCARKSSVKISNQIHTPTYFLALAYVLPALTNVTCKILRIEHYVQYTKVEMHELYTMK
jgi:hypothetical protein